MWAAIAAVLAVALGWALYLARHVLLLIYVSALFAIGLSPLVRWLERRRVAPFRSGRLPHWGAALAVYVGISVFGYFVETATDFLVLALLVAVVQGGTQALSRSLFASLIPRHKSAEFFGFYGVFDKFAGILGPLLFGLTVGATGSSRRATSPPPAASAVRSSPGSTR